MRKTAKDVCEANFDFTCPECKQPLKPRIRPKEEDKSLVCGGCGKEFDCDDLPPADQPNPCNLSIYYLNFIAAISFSSPL